MFSQTFLKGNKMKTAKEYVEIDTNSWPLQAGLLQYFRANQGKVPTAWLGAYGVGQRLISHTLSAGPPIHIFQCCLQRAWHCPKLKIHKNFVTFIIIQGCIIYSSSYTCTHMIIIFISFYRSGNWDGKEIRDLFKLVIQLVNFRVRILC